MVTTKATDCHKTQAGFQDSLNHGAELGDGKEECTRVAKLCQCSLLVSVMSVKLHQTPT